MRKWLFGCVNPSNRFWVANCNSACKVCDLIEKWFIGQPLIKKESQPFYHIKGEFHDLMSKILEKEFHTYFWVI